jgi:hypothetical protein
MPLNVLICGLLISLCSHHLFASDLRLGRLERSWNGELSAVVILDEGHQLETAAHLSWDDASGLVLLRAVPADPDAATVRFTTVPGGVRLEISANDLALAPGVIAHLTFANRPGHTSLPRLRLAQIGLTPAESSSEVLIDSASLAPRQRGARPVEKTFAMKLINDALAKGEIDAETALVYRVLAAFEDPRLPGQYRGTRVTAGIDTLVMTEVAGAFETLSPQSQQIIAPFLIPPFHEGSWDDISSNPNTSRLQPNGGATLCGPILTGWKSIPSPSGKVRIWWKKDNPEDELPAGHLGLVADQMLQKYTALLGRQPILDKGSSLPCRGGDDAIDVALVDKGSQAIQYFPVTGAGSSYVLLERRAADGLEMTLAHELFHVMQYTYEVQGTFYAGYRWLMEATATWAQDYYSPAGNSGREHRAAPHFLQSPQLSFDTRNDGFEYGSYLFFLYLTRTWGNQLIPTIWNAAAQNSALDAVNGAIDGGFKVRWHEFALYNWNRGPVDNYQRWDQLGEQAKAEMEKISIPSGGEKRYEMPIDLPHLSASYYRYEFTDPNARTITFYNGLSHSVTERPVQLDGVDKGIRYVLSPLKDQDLEDAQIHALIRIGDRWIQDDWTKKPMVTFCRNLLAERVDEIVIIYSNAQFTDRSKRLNRRGKPPVLVASNSGCGSWTGTLKATHPLWSLTVTDATFTKPAPFLMPLQGEDAFAVLETIYTATAGKMKWEVKPSMGDCTLTGSYSGPLPNEGNIHLAVNEHVPVSSRAFRTYWGLGFVNHPELKYTAHCPGAPPAAVAASPVSILLTPIETHELYRMPSSGSELKNTFGPNESWEWNLRSVPE